MANQAAKAGCNPRTALTRYSSRENDQDTMTDAEKATVLKYIRLMQVSNIKCYPASQDKFINQMQICIVA